MELIFPKETAAKYGALCLDGTPYAYYFQAGSLINSTKWVIHLQGNGWCFTKESCLARSETPEGSSGSASTYLIYGGPVMENQFYNPEYYDWNHVVLLGCDGGSFSGDLEDPVVVDGRSIYFRGHRNVKATFEDLLTNRGLDKATDVMFSGDFDGGVGVFLHANEVKSMLPKSITRFKVVPMSGIILDHPNAEGKNVFSSQMKDFFEMANCSGSCEPQCLASMGVEDRYKCMFAQYTMQYVQPPMFIISSAYDQYATSCVLGAEPIVTGDDNCSAVPGWADCEKNTERCTSDQWKAIEEYGETFEKTVEDNPIITVPGNGMFEYTCHKFTAELGVQWYLLSIDKTKMRDAVKFWFSSNNEPAGNHTYKPCQNHGDFCCNVECCLPDKQ